MVYRQLLSTDLLQLLGIIVYHSLIECLFELIINYLSTNVHKFKITRYFDFDKDGSILIAEVTFHFNRFNWVSRNWVLNSCVHKISFLLGKINVSVCKKLKFKWRHQIIMIAITVQCVSYILCWSWNVSTILPQPSITQLFIYFTLFVKFKHSN